MLQRVIFALLMLGVLVVAVGSGFTVSSLIKGGNDILRLGSISIIGTIVYFFGWFGMIVVPRPKKGSMTKSQELYLVVLLPILGALFGGVFGWGMTVGSDNDLVSFVLPVSLLVGLVSVFFVPYYFWKEPKRREAAVIVRP